MLVISDASWLAAGLADSCSVLPISDLWGTVGSMCSDSCMSVRASWLRPWSACETAEAHEARHPGFGYHQTCPQCRFYKRAQSWMGAYGTVPAPGHGFDSAQWLDERPSHWGPPSRLKIPAKFVRPLSQDFGKKAKVGIGGICGLSFFSLGLFWSDLKDVV